MSDALPAFVTAFAAVCLWLAIRVVNRRQLWASWSLALAVSIPALYAVSFGPACWLNERGYLSDWDVIDLYGPILKLESNERLPQPFAWYAGLGARGRAEAYVEFGRITWSNRCKSGLKRIRLSSP
jgi:hypothetical protein